MDLLKARVRCLQAGLGFSIIMAACLLLLAAMAFFHAASMGLGIFLTLLGLVALLFAAAWLLSGALYTLLVIAAIALSKNKLPYKALWILIVWLVFFVGAIGWELAGRKSLKLEKKYRS